MKILRDYQEETVSFLINEDGKLVLGLCPNAGKTEITINFIEDYLKQEENKDKKILVLAHSTTVLLNNFTDRLLNSDISFSFSENLKDENSQVHVSLPQRKSKISFKYDIIIVDEAHENFLAKTVQQIVNDCQPIKTILLTGTPSKFIGNKEYKFFFYSLSELKKEYRSNLSIKISNSEYDWEGNYNAQNEIKSSFKFGKEETEKSLIESLKGCIYNDSKNKIEKTLIVCKTINQSEFVRDYLISQNIDCVISNSQNDSDSIVVTEFKNGEHDILIVVNRARLGFDDSNLVNLIDMSGTLNPDLIYQMYSRVCRKGNVENKRYIRLRGKNEKLENTKIAVNIALMLTSKKYLSSFNGKNLSGQEILMPKSFFKKTTNKKQSKQNEVGEKDKKMFFEDVENVIDFYVECLNNESDYKVCEVSEVISYLGGRVRKTITPELVKEVCSKFETYGELQNKDKGVYQWVIKNKHLKDELFPHLKQVRRIITSELVKEVCLTVETHTELQNKDKGVYSFVLRNPHLKEELFPHLKQVKRRRITSELIKEVCSTFETITELRKKDKGIFLYIYRNKHLKEDLFPHLVFRKHKNNEKKSSNIHVG